MTAPQCPASCCRTRGPAVVLETAPKERYSQAHRALEILRAPQKHGYLDLGHAMISVLMDYAEYREDPVRRNPGNYYTQYYGKFPDNSRLDFAINDEWSPQINLRGYNAWTPSENREIEARLGHSVAAGRKAA